MATEASYIDYETFLGPAFSAPRFANELVLATNDPTDITLDLATPLSRVLFDVQEVDTHIDDLTTKSALPLLEYTEARTTAGTRVLEKVEEQVISLTESYKRLEQNVIVRHEAAEQVRLAADRLCQTVKLGRSVLRCLQGARQLEMFTSEMTAAKQARSGGTSTNGHTSMVPAARSLLLLREMLSADSEGLDQIALVASVRANVIASCERNLLSRSQQLVREFSVTGTLNAQGGPAPSGHQTATFAQLQDISARTTSACEVLYLLSPAKPSATKSSFEPGLLVTALQSYLQTALSTSLSSLARALAALPTLDRTLVDISARCQSVVALEALLRSIQAPEHPAFPETKPEESMDGSDEGRHDLLQPLLANLDTSSLPSYFWRSLASSLSSRVREIITRGGVSARTLRSSRESVAQSVRECVQRGSEASVAADIADTAKEDGARPRISWEREAAVMVGSITGQLGRS